VQYDTTINEWHTCPESGRINASNPCSEYMFLDDTACNLASLNLIAFLKDDGSFDVGAFAHAVRLWTTVLEISVMMAQYPSERIAEFSYRYRTLGLGYANLGGLLMASGIAYDSHKGRALAGAITALMTGEAYAQSAQMAKQLGPFAGYGPNREAMLRVIRNHRRAAHGEKRDYEGLSVRPVPLDAARIPDQALLDAARDAWDRALEWGEASGYRNAQATVIAPTGTIGLVMDCDTTGIEPDFALVKFKKLAGGGYFKIINRMVPKALAVLGYGPEQFVGDGLTMFLGFNETWRLRRKFGERYYRQFWGQMIHQLASRRALGTQKRFVVQTDRQQYKVDDKVILTVEAFDANYQPLADDQLEEGRLLAEVFVPGRQAG
jgi:ribonucleoside-diphosphate reductase alpha chain